MLALFLNTKLNTARNLTPGSSSNSNSKMDTTGLKIVLSVLLLIGVAALVYYVYPTALTKSKSTSTSKSGKCKPSDKEKNPHGKTYKYESDGDCALTSCVDGYTFDSSVVSCTKLPDTNVARAGQVCIPKSQEKVPHGNVYVWGRDGEECLVSNCFHGYDADLGSGKCNKNL